MSKFTSRQWTSYRVARRLPCHACNHATFHLVRELYEGFVTGCALMDQGFARLNTGGEYGLRTRLRLCCPVTLGRGGLDDGLPDADSLR